MAGGEHLDFDRAAARWRQLLRDWLAVAAEGPTDWPQDYYGATIWGLPGYDDEEITHEPPQGAYRHVPESLRAATWSHALCHASAGDQPPLAWTLMTSATRAAVATNWRVAILDAATATEIALTAGLAALSASLSPADQQQIAKTRMLGPLMRLSKVLGMSLPPDIDKNLLSNRNVVVHQGTGMTRAQATAAVDAAWDVVRQYDPLPACCRALGSPPGA